MNNPLPWLRIYTRARHNPKIQRLPGEAFKAWFNLLCLSGDRDGYLPAVEDIAFELRLPERKTALLIADFIARRLVDETGDGRLRMHDWDEHQFRADVSTARVKRFRERHAKRDETVSETAPDTEQIQSREETDANASAKKASDHDDRPNGRTAGRGTRLPADWRPDGEDRAFAEQASLDPDAIAAEFRDYWHAKPGSGGVKLDWPATWRNWCRHAAERRGGPQGAGRGRAGVGGVSVTQAVGEYLTAIRDRA